MEPQSPPSPAPTSSHRNITISDPSMPITPYPLPPSNPQTHASEILSQFARLSLRTQWRRVEVVPFEGDLWEPEGIVRLGNDRYFVSAGEYTVPTERFPDGEWRNGTDRTAGAGFGHIMVFDGRGKRIADAVVSEKGSTEYHLGGIDYDGTHIWATLSEYRPNSTATILRIDPSTLRYEPLFRVADHQGGIVHGTDTSTLTTLNWGSREASVWSLQGRRFNPLPGFSPPEAKARNPSHWVDYQDCKFLGCVETGPYAGRPVMLCSGVATLQDGTQVGGMAIVDALTMVPLMEVPITLRTDKGVLVTKNPVDVDVVGGKMRLYFLPEEHDSTLYVYEAEDRTD
ncbi:hypothetical protein SODALDRAFT_272337 [Sodiomyces alkalinus F11]|uniref:SMP-30/Gluconolactonase/LRE-like region domain-containing protein n=1 Tax=Sodiomyces alkalinus (strain CBS 110278 / VKM F-3762 / F11) TaxID=1314773 RepID=A0A3N2Q4K1_SODAK|nr:hypothetical protein SODALDRAFT_272337 [Sodiomyces alkalinus F11]ROT41627.1 hypothetical protein SODALDRAFT_272337 [Sodiomyces alkalinus F11]